jgi:hypothetical protein
MTTTITYRGPEPLWHALVDDLQAAGATVRATPPMENRSAGGLALEHTLYVVDGLAVVGITAVVKHYVGKFKARGVEVEVGGKTVDGDGASDTQAKS